MHWSEDTKRLVYEKYKEINNMRQVSELLKIPKTTVIRIIKNYEKCGNFIRKMGSGRKNSLNDNDLEKIKKSIKKIKN